MYFKLLFILHKSKIEDFSRWSKLIINKDKATNPYKNRLKY